MNVAADADIFLQPSALAETYAAALLSLARQRQVLRPLLEELEAAVRLLETVEGLIEWARDPGVPVERKMDVLERAFRGRLSDLACDAVLVICRHGRLGRLPEIVQAFRLRVEQAEGLVRVLVVSASELDESQRRQVESALAERLGARAVMTVRVDPTILGGMIVQTADRRIDLSARQQLEQLTTALRRRTAQTVAAHAREPEGPST